MSGQAGVRRRRGRLRLVVGASLAAAALAGPSAPGASAQAGPSESLAASPVSAGPVSPPSAPSARPAPDPAFDDGLEVPVGTRDATGELRERPRPRPRTGTGAAAARAGVPGATLGARTVLVLRVRYAAEPPPTRRTFDPATGTTSNVPYDPEVLYTEAFVRERISGDPSSASALFGAQSAGAVSLTGATDPRGDVSPWLTVAGTLPQTSPSVCDHRQIARDALAAASAAAVGTAAYDHLVIAFPPNAKCSWSGLGELPGRTSWINGFYAGETALDASIIAHEVGHNLGVAHASSLACTGPAATPAALSTTCSEPEEYGDPFDLMGGGYPVRYPWSPTQLMSSWHRAQLLQLPAARQQVAQGTGVYELLDGSAASAPDAGPTLLRVPRGIGPAATRELVLEFRSGGSRFDTWTGVPGPSTGVMVRLAPDLATAARSQLLDMSPGTATLTDAPLAPGQTFTDPISGVVIETLSAGLGRASVRIAGPRLADRAGPVFAPGTPSVVRDRLDAVLAWPAATDPGGVVAYEIERDGVRVSAVAPPVTTARDRLPTGTGTATYVVVAVDTAGNRTATAPLSIALQPDAPLGGEVPSGPTPPAASPRLAPTPDGGGSPPPTPTSTPAQRAAPGATTPLGTPVLLRPTPRSGKAKVPRSGQITVSVPGADRIVASRGGRTLASSSADRLTLTLPKAARVRGAISLQASGGTPRSTVRAELRVRGGVVRLVALPPRGA